ncbi:hypothetical protein BDD12DRAFT_810848 [Trichophaea hybrida]|nr:hypothetical protein BDD12DRAFT_810848 [Trichophaea hybrida]
MGARRKTRLRRVAHLNHSALLEADASQHEKKDHKTWAERGGRLIEAGGRLIVRSGRLIDRISEKFYDSISTAEMIRQLANGCSIKFIAVIGLTGAGNSSIIKTLTAINVHISYSINAGTPLSSRCTSTFAMFPTSIDGQRYILIDTPGFNDENRDDVEIFREILNWFVIMTPYCDLSGILYAHDITHHRFDGFAEPGPDPDESLPTAQKGENPDDLEWDKAAEEEYREADEQRQKAQFELCDMIAYYIDSETVDILDTAAGEVLREKFNIPATTEQVGIDGGSIQDPRSRSLALVPTIPEHRSDDGSSLLSSLSCWTADDELLLQSQNSLSSKTIFQVVHHRHCQTPSPEQEEEQKEEQKEEKEERKEEKKQEKKQERKEQEKDKRDKKEEKEDDWKAKLWRVIKWFFSR